MALIQAEDRDFFERELASFLPDRVFDAHAHVWAHRNMHPSRRITSLPRDGDFKEFSRMLRALHPGRVCAANIFHRICPPEHFEGANLWTSRQVRCDSRYRGLFLTSPEADPEWLRQEVRRLGLAGLKCYHVYAKVKPTWEAQIPDFLPESHVRVAHQEGWAIMLHMVRSRACADPGNLRWIRHYCTTYPNMRLILAHSARGFQPAHNLEGLPHLKGLGSIPAPIAKPWPTRPSSASSATGGSCTAPTSQSATCGEGRRQRPIPFSGLIRIPPSGASGTLRSSRC